jgi:hypothetical protein
MLLCKGQYYEESHYTNQDDGAYETICSIYNIYSYTILRTADFHLFLTSMHLQRVTLVMSCLEHCKSDVYRENNWPPLWIKNDGYY